MKCPGQDMQYWKPGAIFESSCPQCGAPVEFFKDDTARRCGRCGHRFVNPRMDFGCAAYCPYAEQCLGTLPEGAAAQRENLLKDRVAVAMKRHYGKDFKRIGRAGRVARHAERIGKAEGGNLAVILSAAYLHEAGPEEARELLAGLGARAELIAEVCAIIARREPPQPGDSVNLRALYDARLLEGLEEERRNLPRDARRPAGGIEGAFSTASGRQAARELLQTE